MTDQPSVPAKPVSPFVPDRKMYAGGIGGVVAFVILSVARHYGYDLQPAIDAWFPPPGTINILAILTTGITGAIFYFVPLSDQDLLKRLNNRIVALAQKDPTVPVSDPNAIPPTQ